MLAVEGRPHPYRRRQSGSAATASGVAVTSGFEGQILEVRPWDLIPMECPVVGTCRPGVDPKKGGCPLRDCWANLTYKERDAVRVQYGVPLTMSMFEA